MTYYAPAPADSPPDEPYWCVTHREPVDEHDEDNTCDYEGETDEQEN